MTVNEFAQDVHKNAVAHGWYDAPITFPEVAVMIHAEISEAVEEWRSGNPVIYGTCALSPENCKFSKICDNVGHPSGADTGGELQAGGRCGRTLRCGHANHGFSCVHGRRY